VLRRLTLLLTVALAAIAGFVSLGRATGVSGLEAETMSLPSWGGTAYPDSAAGGGQALLIWSNATASATVTTASARSISVRARGDQCAGAPRMVVAVDGAAVIVQNVTSTGWATYGGNVALPDGAHTVSISLTNDYLDGACDRNLRIDRLDFSSTPGPEAEGMALPSSQGMVFSDASASGGQGLLNWSNGTASES
jgi:hypothetical protein